MAIQTKVRKPKSTNKRESRHMTEAAKKEQLKWIGKLCKERCEAIGEPLTRKQLKAITSEKL